MSYNTNPFQAGSYDIEEENQNAPPIYKDTIKRETIYEKVKINKPIILPVAYDNSNVLNQNFNYNQYNNEIYTQEATTTNYNNYNDLIYEQTDTNNNYNYNYDNTVYTNNSNTYNYDNQINTNNIYDYNNLIDGQTINEYQTTNYNNNITYNNQNIDFTDINSYNNMYSPPFITNVVDDNEITYVPKTNQLKANKIEFAEITKLPYEKENIIYNQNSNSEEETNLIKNSNITFGKNSIGSSTTNNNENIKIQPIISNNVNTNTNITNNIITQEYSKTVKQNINPNLNINNKVKIIKTNEQMPQSIKKETVVRQVPKYEKVAKVKKLTEDDVPLDTNYKPAQIKKIETNEIITTNNINIPNEPEIIKPKVYDANMKLQYVMTAPKIELPLKKEKDMKIQIQKQIELKREPNPMYTVQNQQNVNIEKDEKEVQVQVQEEEEEQEEEQEQEQKQIDKNNENNKTNIEIINNDNLKLYKNSKTPLRRPLDDYKSRAKTPLMRGFHPVRIMKKNPSQNSFFVEDKIMRNINNYYKKNYNSKFPKDIRNNENKNPRISVVKLNNANKTRNIEYNNTINNNNKNIEFNNDKDSKAFSKVKRVNRILKSNDFMDTYDQVQNFDDLNSKKMNEFNNISDIQYEHNNSTDNENLQKEEENNMENYSYNYNKEELNNNNNNNMEQNENINENEKINEDYDNNLNNNDILKMDNFDFEDSNMNFNKEEKNDIRDSNLKRMKNNDGLDEFDNNFNNHDKFYNKMKNIFDD